MESERFARYLEAKYFLDDRSLNDEVRRRFREAAAELAGTVTAGAALRVCDLGTGTGAMVRRVLAAVPGPLEVTAVDLDERELRRAAALTRRALSAAGFQARETADGLAFADCGGRTSTVRFQALDLSSAAGRRELTEQQFDIVTAHAVMDLLPIVPTLRALAASLAPGGLFYATLTYNGRTTLAPGYSKRVFEDELLEEYDASMAQRGSELGGRHAGARLFDAVLASRLTVMAFGAADWQIVPRRGRYLHGESEVARALIEMIFAELSNGPPEPRHRAPKRRAAGERSPHGRGSKQAELERWRPSRLRQIEAGELAIVVHHTDLLARSPAADQRRRRGRP